jgi:hypothetical protein
VLPGYQLKREDSGSIFFTKTGVMNTWHVNLFIPNEPLEMEMLIVRYVRVTLEKQVSVGRSRDASVAFGWFPDIHTLLGPTWIG